ncbi:hypothetical protein OS122_08920 [Mycolicibacterium mucogenicum]|uniref:hypothetical protein n=1 Tax=Mycolicibacterium mucogenicum TaxID=56689 RepID=UPI002269F771|nr:hypothetical protein [Mycolicibacterium mucogenicum]MCX8561005.1 hypothetical protein [Mycolicibacterium mucogenicum]
MPDQTLTLDAVIAGRAVSRDEVLAWEAKRLPRAARKIGLAVPVGDLARQRTAFADTKLALGADDVRRRLARDVRASGVVARGLTALSFGRRATSVCDLHVTGGNAGAFVDWFTDAGRDDYARSMIAANPDHFLIDTAPDGRQEVIEATGGSPLATQFFIDYDDTSPLVTPRDPAFPVEAAGVARTGAGLAIGGVRHEFRDEANGFHARLCIEFPWLTAPYLIAQHRWHLACEFSNWIEAAFARR